MIRDFMSEKRLAGKSIRTHDCVFSLILKMEITQLNLNRSLKFRPKVTINKILTMNDHQSEMFDQ